MAATTIKAAAQALTKVAPAKTVETDLWGGIGYLYGDTTYQIGGKAKSGGLSGYVNDPLSELKWPERAIMGRVGGNVKLIDRFDFHGQFDKSITDFSDKVEDSDWTDPYRPRAKTVYSESDATFDSFSVDFGFRHWLLGSASKGKAASGFAIAPGVGVVFQKNKWTSSNVDQWDPQNPWIPHDLVFGELATYKTTTTMPYTEIAIRTTGKRFSFSGSLELAYAMVSDEDNHLLRQKLSKSNNSGIGGKLSLQERFAISKVLFVQAQADVFGFYVTGTQNQSSYDGLYQASIDSRIFSVQAMITAGVGVTF